MTMLLVDVIIHNGVSEDGNILAERRKARLKGEKMKKLLLLIVLLVATCDQQSEIIQQYDLSTPENAVRAFRSYERKRQKDWNAYLDTHAGMLSNRLKSFYRGEKEIGRDSISQTVQLQDSLFMIYLATIDSIDTTIMRFKVIKEVGQWKVDDVEFKCTWCKATGICSYCEGSGIWLGKKCSFCDATGRCMHCKGTGWYSYFHN